MDTLKGWTVTGGDPSSTFIINWGDGTAKSQTKTFGEKVWHTYRSGGSYSLTAEVTRPGGAKVTAQSAVIVTPLKYLFCDIKRPLAQREWDLNSGNYRQVIDAMKNELGCNGIRVGIDSKTSPRDIAKIAPDSTPEGYTKLYRDVFAYARQKNLLIYSNLLPGLDAQGNGVNEFGYDVTEWANNVSAYANYFCPDFVSPFSENDNFDKHSVVVNGVRTRMSSSCTDPGGKVVRNIPIVAPNSKDIRRVKRLLNGGTHLGQPMQADPSLPSSVDIFSTQNNVGGLNAVGGGHGGDRSMTEADWKELRTLGGDKPTWASEFSAGLGYPPTGGWDVVPTAGDAQGMQTGVKAVIDSGVISGLVLYMAPRFIDDTDGDGIYTLKSMAGILAQGLCATGWDRSCPKVLGASTTREASLIEIIWSYITGTIGAAAAALFNFPF